jgi:alcohol dehydrogenase (NADP+)
MYSFMLQYANYARVPAHFVVKVSFENTLYPTLPDVPYPTVDSKGIPPAMAAPMLCGGITVYAPLKKYGAGTTAKDVGIIGIGGLVRMHSLFHQGC